VEALVGLKRFDEVRVLPVYRHTFASKRDQLLSFDHRVAMCRLAVEGLSSLKQSWNDESENDSVVHTAVVVSRAEEDSFRRMLLSSNATTDEEKALLRVGTADLLEMLLEQENDASKGAGAAGVEFSFCLGADTFLDLTDWKWKRSRDVLKLLEGRLVVVNRKQQEETPNSVTTTTTIDPLQERIESINASPLANGNILLLDVPSLGNVSSSKIRNATNKDSVSHMLSPKVLDYVIANKLYGFGE